MRRLVARALLLLFAGGRSFRARGDARLNSTKLLTIDVFDTLVTRVVYHPTDVFMVVGSVLQRLGTTEIDASSWGHVRSEAEAAMRATTAQEEIKLSEIYQSPLMLDHVAEDRLSDILDLELKLERALSRPIAAMIDCVNSFSRGGGIVVAVSDTYLPTTEVGQLLDQAGLDRSHISIITSVDRRLTKRSGALFKSMLPEWRHLRGKWLHVGDNMISDFLRPRLAGLRAAPLLATKPSCLEKALHSKLAGLGIVQSAFAGSARATRLGRSFADEHSQALWDVSANMTGPLLFAFVAWTLREAVHRGIGKLYFFARDGEILMKIVAELQPVVAPMLECRYLYVSRKSLHLPAVTEFGDSQREWLFDKAIGSTLKGFLARLNMTVDDYTALLPAGSELAKLDATSRLTPPLVGEIERSLEIDAIRRLVLERAAASRKDCLAYLTQEGMLEAGPVGVVDIGWRGRLQRSICTILSTEDERFSDRLHGFYFDLDHVPTNSGTFTRFTELYEGAQFHWAARASLFEVLCSANHGTTTGYETDASGAVRPTLASVTNKEAVVWGVDLEQDAVVEFSRNVLIVLAIAGIEPLAFVPALAQASLTIAKMVILRPTRAEADALGSFGHASDEQHKAFEQIAGTIEFAPQALMKRFGPSYRGRRISYWPEASVVRSTPRSVNNLALSLLRVLPGRG